MSESASQSLRPLIDAGDWSALMAYVPYARFLGVRIERIEGRLRFEMPFDDKLIGNTMLPALHGGAVAGFMENAALMQVLIEQKQNRVPKPVDFAIDYMRPGRPETTWASVDIVREGRRVILARIDAWQSDQTQSIAQARAHLLVEDG